MKCSSNFIGIILFLTLYLGICSELHAQFVAFGNECPTYELLGGTERPELYDEALSSASFEIYRFRHNHRIIEFEDGTQVKLLSAAEIQKCNPNIKLEPYTTEQSVNNSRTLIFKLFPNGNIGVRSIVNPASKLAKIGNGFPRKDLIIISKADFDRLPESKQEVIMSRPHQYVVE